MFRSDLETVEIDFDELLVHIKIERGDTELAEAKGLPALVVNKIFRRCSDGKWYTSSADWGGPGRPINEAPTSVTPIRTDLVIKFEGFLKVYMESGDDES